MWKKRTQRDQPALEWVESRTVKRQDELRIGDRLIATLRWGGWGSTFAEGQASAGSWAFERPRLLSRDVQVHRAGTEGPAVAVFRPGWTEEGTLYMADGRTMRWESRDFWRSEWAFVDTAGQTALRFRDTSGLFHERTAAWIYKVGLSETDRALLLILGRYLMVLQARDRAATVAATSATFSEAVS